ncbi:PREDICTED: cytochrome P450 4C1-like [Nicrophorus vespilloides]|uniref:Cytochrome P450 4C1-like n=1 Tax=Nicrophorus vespilloides TaxID=110193 RepID=A0ABM1MI05_NICVS|nr:PREDICTED: cytochrome P450 4C1-like [Nicrophorus vespilloides]
MRRRPKSKLGLDFLLFVGLTNRDSNRKLRPNMLHALALLVAALLAVVFYIQLKKNAKINKYLEHIPGPKPLPIVGNSYNIIRNPKGVLLYFAENVKKYGTVSRYWIGRTLYVFLNDPRDFEILLKDTKNIRKSRTYDFIIPWLGTGLVTSTGDHWHKHRKLITPAFHFNILEKFVEVFNERGKVLIDILKKKANGEIFDVFPIITMYTLDAITETSMGLKMNLQDETVSPYVDALNNIQRGSQRRTWNVFLQPDFIFRRTSVGKQFYKSIEFINSYCMKVIDEKTRALEVAETKPETTTDDFGRKKRMAFLDLLITNRKNGFTVTDMLDEVNTFMFAGHDTTSSAISFALYALSKNADVQERLYDEIVSLFGTDERDLTYSDLQSTVYLDQVVKESLRLFPPVATYSRLIEHDLKLTNVTIPAGTSLACFAYMLHRNPEHFPEPEVFDPERFNAENTAKRHPFAYAPFSAGPRNCIGQRYAILEIKLTLIEILKNFKILPGKDIDNIQSYIILTAPDGINIRLQQRPLN